jgi:hypothetical protein
MCSGYITRHSCGHEDRAYYYVCRDGVNEHYQELLPHRLVGRKFRTAWLCRDCEELRRDEETLENDNRQTHEERAKALMEYFRGERPWPRPDDEVSENFAHAYAAGERLHPWLNRGNEPALERHRTLIIESFANTIDPEFSEAGTRSFQIMLDRQADIDRTGRPITAADREFVLSRLVERGVQFAAKVRNLARQDELREREQARESNLTNQVRDRVRAQLSVAEQRIDDLSGMMRDREMEQEIHQLRDQIRVTRQELDLRRGLIDQGLQERDQSMEETRELEPVIQQQEVPQVEQRAGFYESDPEWLLNFDDWCLENSPEGFPYTETDLRRDLNGWFQHLRSCESQLRLDWIPFAESYRDAIQAGDRCRYEYSPLPNDTEGQRPSSFRIWCIDNVNAADVRVLPMNSVFIYLLQEYEAYLRTNGWFADLQVFQFKRWTRIKTMCISLALIPGAPLSRLSEDQSINIEDTPSIKGMCDDIGRLCREGSSTAEVDILQRQADISRLNRLHDEAREVHEGRLAGFRMEREEREARAREREERDREERRQQDLSDSDADVLVATTRIPAVIQNTINELHRGAPWLPNPSENLSGPARRIYDEWRRAAREARVEERASREAEEEAEGPRRVATAREVPRRASLRELPRRRRRHPRPSARLLAN